MSGKVYLVGAGPGAPDLLTLRAARLLEQADIVFTDALVDPGSLALAAKATIVHVGKRAGMLSTEQRFISRALVAAARHHRVVVRLKGGDPMLFGRAQEEISALQEASVAYEVVPGVSAAFAAAATLGASLTQRGIARSVSFATPRVGAGEDDDPAWLDAAAHCDTVVLYMAAGQAEAVSTALIGRGRSPETPCAVVANASLPQEQVVLSTLAQLPKATPILGPGPALVIIGEILACLPEDMGENQSEPTARQVV